MMRLFDAHLHIVDPSFVQAGNDGYLAAPFTVDQYRQATGAATIVGGAVVAGSFQGFEQEHLLASLRSLGPGFVGVAQLRPEISDTDIVALDAAGVRAIRFNLVRRVVIDVTTVIELGNRVADLCGWHVELYVDARDLTELEPHLSALPRVVVDHLGLAQQGLPALLRHVDRGGYVKASGFGRVDMPIPAVLQTIARRNPGALLFGTDMPSTRAPRPFRWSDVDLVLDALDPDEAERAMWRNAVELYHPHGIPASLLDGTTPLPDLKPEPTE